MIKITTPLFDAPKIAIKLKDSIDRLDEPDNYVLSLQLNYRDNNTLFYLKKVTHIHFEKEWLEIEQENNSHAFFDYKHILEYCVINAEDIIDLGDI